MSFSDLIKPNLVSSQWNQEFLPLFTELLIVLHFDSPVDEALKLVSQAQTAVQLVDYFHLTNKCLENVPPNTGPKKLSQNRLDIKSLNQEIFDLLVSTFDKIEKLQLVILSKDEFTQVDRVSQLILRFASTLTELNIWIKIRHGMIDGRKTSNLDALWNTINGGHLNELSSLSIEVQQFNPNLGEGFNVDMSLMFGLNGSFNRAPFEISLPNLEHLPKLKRFSFGSPDYSTTVWQALTKARSINQQLVQIEFGLPILPFEDEDNEDNQPNASQLYKTSWRIYQIGVKEVRDAEQLADVCRSFPELRKFYIQTEIMNASEMVKCVAASELEDLIDLRLCFAVPNGTRLFHPKPRNVSLPTVHSLTIGILCVPTQVDDDFDLSGIAPLFPNIKGLVLRFRDRKSQNIRSTNFYKEMLRNSGVLKCEELRKIRLDFLHLDGISLEYASEDIF